MEKIDDELIRRIRNNPGARFADLFDLDLKTLCSKVSPNVAVFNLFRVADRRLQALRREKIIEYRHNGWYLKQ